MDNCICKSALEDDGHTNPNIHASKENLLILFIFLGMIEEDTMQELKIIEFRNFNQLNWTLAVAANCCLLFLISSAQEGINHILSSLEILDLLVSITDITLSEGKDIGIVNRTFVFYFFCYNNDCC